MKNRKPSPTTPASRRFSSSLMGAGEFESRVASHGSPGLQACWDDETCNFKLKLQVMAAHRSVWHGRALASAAAANKRGRKRRRE